MPYRMRFTGLSESAPATSEWASSATRALFPSRISPSTVLFTRLPRGPPYCLSYTARRTTSDPFLTPSIASWRCRRPPIESGAERGGSRLAPSGRNLPAVFVTIPRGHMRSSSGVGAYAAPAGLKSAPQKCSVLFLPSGAARSL